MAQTVRVDVSIEAVDKTASGVNSAQKRLSSFEKSIAKTEKQLAKLEEKHTVNIDARDMASEKVDSLSADVNQLNGRSADVTVEAELHDAATDGIHDVESAADELDSMSAETDLEANDMATEVIHDAAGAVDEFDNSSGEADLEAEDMATDVIHGAESEVDTFDGMNAHATIAADDEASAVIEDVTGKAKEWSGSTFAASIGFLGVSTGVADTINTYKDFQSTMSEVEAIAGATSDEIDQLTETAKKYGAETKFTATEAAEAFNYMAMAGWDASEMQEGIGGILSLAAASGEDLASVSDIVTDAMTAFGYGADQVTRFSDVLAVAAAYSNTDVGMMGESFKYVGSMAGTLGYEIEDVSVALGLMANSGIKSSMAGTSLNMLLTRLSTNTNGARDAIEELGVEFYNSDGSARPLINVLDEIRQATADMTTEERTAFASTVAGTASAKGLNAILNASAEDWENLASAVYDADGASEQMAETMMDNLSGSLTLFQSAYEGVQDTIGERVEPYLRTAIDSLTEILPGASEKINDFMTKFDSAVKTMTVSDEWKNADLFGKVNIAWDKIIAEPFTKWAGSKGKNLLSKGLSSLFSEAAKVLPGGEEAGLTSWLSAGLVAKGATSLVSTAGNVVSALSPVGKAIKSVANAAADASSIGSFTSSLWSMIPTAGKVSLAAAAITASVVAIGTAIDNYNSKVVSESLEEHFGDIQLTAEQAQEAAEGILDQKYLVNVELALNEIENADELRKTAEEALESNQALTWKSSVGIELTEDEQTEYTDNVETFVNSKLEELESRTYAAHLTVETFLADTDAGDTLSSQIEEWARADDLELTDLSNDLKSAVEDALKDGVISVDEAEAAAELEDKINNISNRWKKAEAQAQLDWISQEYGTLSGKDLDSESFTSVVEALSAQRETAASESQSLATEFYEYLNAAQESGRISSDQNAQYHELAGEAIRNQEAEDLATSLDFETNTLNGTYGEKIQANIQNTKEALQNQLGFIQTDVDNDVLDAVKTYISSGADTASSGTGKTFGVVTDADQNALSGIWESMKPDADAMTELIDEYVNAGQEIPETIRDKFNETMEIGAAAGDTDAAWQVYANSLAESGDQAMIDAINQMDAEGSLSEEFSEAWKRALQGVTDEPVELDSLKAEVDGSEIETDVSNVSDVTDKISESISDSESTVETTTKVNNTLVDGETTDETTDLSTSEEMTDEVTQDAVLNTTLTQGSDNISEICSAVNADITDVFSSGFSTSAPVSVHLNYSISNPSASVSLSGGASGSATVKASIASNASGDRVDGMTLSWLSEEGPEYVIPTTGRYKQRGKDLWIAAGEELGMLDDISQNAAGAYVNGESEINNPFTARQQSLFTTASETSASSEAGSDESQPVSVVVGDTGSTGNEMAFSVVLNPTIQIEGKEMSEEKVFGIIKARIRELGDDIADELAAQMAKAFDNMPITQGV